MNIEEMIKNKVIVPDDRLTKEAGDGFACYKVLSSECDVYYIDEIIKGFTHALKTNKWTAYSTTGASYSITKLDTNFPVYGKLL